jgi:hypothetical protein
MANKKLSELTTKTSIGSSDLFPIADATTGQLYKKTVSDLAVAIGGGVSSVNTLTGVVVLNADNIAEASSPTNKYFTDLRARGAISAGTGISYNSSTGVITNTGQPLSTNLTSLAGLSYASTSFVKMTASGTFALDTNTYLPLSGGTLTGALSGTSASFNSQVGIITSSSGAIGVVSSSSNLVFANSSTFAYGISTNNSGGLDIMANQASQPIRLWSGTAPTSSPTLSATFNGTNVTFYGLLTGTNATFNGNVVTTGSSAGFNINRRDTSAYAGGWYSPSGSVLLDMTTAGTVLTFAVTTGAATFASSVTASSFVKSGGSSSQFLKADGSVDSTTYKDSLNSFSRKTASYTLVLGDKDKVIEMNVGSANTLTIPTNGSVAFPIGTEITVMQYGSGQTTIAQPGGVTIRSKGGYLKIADQYTGVTLVKVGTDEWYLIGNLAG